MPILVATDREVVVFDVEGGSSVPAEGISDRPPCLAADHLFMDERGVGRIGTARSGPTMVDGPGALSALRVG